MRCGSITTARATLRAAMTIQVAWPAWLATISHAVSLVRKADVGEVCLVGLRFGASLGAEAAANDGEIDQLVLWDPCVSGRSFLREQRAISTITLGTASDSADGSVEIPGVRYDATTANDIEGINIEKCALPLRVRVLLLSRDDRPTSRSLLRASLAREELSHEQAAGQTQFMDQYPPLQELPRATIGLIAEWLCDGSRPRASPIRIPERAGARLVGRGPSGPGIAEVPVRIPRRTSSGSSLTQRSWLSRRTSRLPYS